MNKFLKLFILLVVVFGFIFIFDNNDAIAETHPSSLSGTAFGTGCKWGITDDNVLYIWPTDGVSGTLPDVSIGSSSYYSINWPWRDSSSSVIRVVVEPGILGNCSLQYMFSQMRNVESIDLSGLSTVGVVKMYGMFSGCSNLVSLDLSNFDTSAVEDMSSMFSSCASLLELDLFGFNTNSVTNMSFMFSGCSFLEFLNMSSFNTSCVTDMSYMFRDCSSLASLSLSVFDTHRVTVMDYMFAGCSSLTELDVSSFDTGRVTNMGSMFSNCSNLLSLDLSSFDTSEVTTVSDMFYECSSMVSLDISGFDMRNVRSFDSMFGYCGSLHTVVLGSFMSFQRGSSCCYLPSPSTSYPYTGEWVCLDNVSYIFSPEQLTAVYDMSMAGTWVWYESAVAVVLYNDGYMSFQFGDFVDSSHGSVIGVYGLAGGFYYDRNTVSNYYVSSNSVSCPWYPYRTSIKNVVIKDNISVGSTAYWFYNCNNLLTLDLSKLNVLSASNMTYMFDGSCNISSIVLGNNFSFKGDGSTYCCLPSNKWRNVDTNAVYTCADLSDVYDGSMAGQYDVLLYDVSEKAYAIYYSNGDLVFQRGNEVDSSRGSVVNMYTDFEDTLDSRPWSSHTSCKRIFFLDVIRPRSTSNWFSRFYGCVEADFSNLDTSRVTDMSYMFYYFGSSDMSFLDLSNLDVSHVLSFDQTFASCNVKVIDLSDWNIGSNVNMQEMFEYFNGESIGQPRWDMSGVLSCADMFRGASNLKIFPGRYWNDLSSARSVYYMFDSCRSLEDVYVEGDWLMPNASSGGMMFRGNHALKRFVVTGTWDMSSVYHVNEIFNGDRSLETFFVGKWNLGSLAYATSTFSNCSSLAYFEVGDWDLHSLTGDLGLIFCDMSVLKTVRIGNWDTSNATACRAFGGSYTLESVYIKNWDARKVSSYSSGFFYNHTALKSFIVENDWDMSLATSNLYGAFYNCSSLEIFRIGGTWDLSVMTTNAYSVFCNCRSLRTFSVGSWIMPSVTNISYMFQNCSSLRELDLHNVGSLNMTDLYNAFYNCSSLERLDISAIGTANVTSCSGCFTGCVALNAVKFGPDWSFKCKPGSISQSYRPLLPDPNDSSRYTNKWIKEDRSVGPYTALQLRDYVDWSPDNAGWWVWESLVPYMIYFSPPVEDTNRYGGSMGNREVYINSDNVLPLNTYYRPAYRFDHWVDEFGKEYKDGDVVRAYAYDVEENDVITFTAVFVKSGGVLSSDTGEFDVDVRSGEKLWLNDIPGQTSYQVWEDTPNGWRLVQTNNAQGAVPANGESNVAFKNRYDPESSQLSIVGQKKVIDSCGVVTYPVCGLYSFTLVQTGGIGSVEETVENGDGGSIVFNPIVLDSVGTYTYEIREISGDDPHMTYDEHVETVVVNVTSDDGALVADIVVDDGGILFTNVLNNYGGFRLTKNAVDDSGIDCWESGRLFVFEVSFHDKYGFLPDDYCNDQLKSVADVNGWDYDVSTGVMTIVLHSSMKSVILDKIPFGLHYDVVEVDAE